MTTGIVFYNDGKLNMVEHLPILSDSIPSSKVILFTVVADGILSIFRKPASSCVFKTFDILSTGVFPFNCMYTMSTFPAFALDQGALMTSSDK